MEMDMDIEIAMERDTETETDIGSGTDDMRSDSFWLMGGCPFVASLQFCVRRSSGELTELLPWTLASSARQWLCELNTESR